jgi:DNA-binding NarL/FixJ family response regulator
MIDREARVLAAADCYHALREPRPHRPAYESAGAEAIVRELAREGRLDRDAVAAVLEAAGHAATRVPAAWPCGLSDREVEVLRRLARGLSNKHIASELDISPRTVQHHVAHVYAKIGTSSRAAATLFATEHALLG